MNEFYGYPISQWVGVAEWFGLMIILGVFVFCLSVYLTNTYFKENKIYTSKKKSAKEKKWFYDVA
jgi:hypothetical protein